MPGSRDEGHRCQYDRAAQRGSATVECVLGREGMAVGNEHRPENEGSKHDHDAHHDQENASSRAHVETNQHGSKLPHRARGEGCHGACSVGEARAQAAFGTPCCGADHGALHQEGINASNTR